LNKTDILTLYDYNYWANERILEATAKVTSDQLIAAANVSHGSLRGALVHILGAEVVWRLRCEEGVSPSAMRALVHLPQKDSPADSHLLNEVTTSGSCYTVS
jgi:uncharacterized damage-inducible protein DinB